MCVCVCVCVLSCADAQGESGRLWPVEELQRLFGSGRRPLWLVYAGEPVGNAHSLLFVFSVYRFPIYQVNYPLFSSAANKTYNSIKLSCCVFMHKPHAFFSLLFFFLKRENVDRSSVPLLPLFKKWSSCICLDMWLIWVYAHFEAIKRSY